VAVVLDSGVVVGFLDRRDALHDAADAAVRRQIAAGEPLVVSAVTFAEVLTGAKLGHHPLAQVRGFFTELVSEVLAVDTAVAEEAATIRAKTRSLRMPDALIAASAHVHDDVTVLFCGDKKLAGLTGLSCRTELIR
jgi:predicted nucleic acid-binding protein